MEHVSGLLTSGMLLPLHATAYFALCSLLQQHRSRPGNSVILHVCLYACFILLYDLTGLDRHASVTDALLRWCGWVCVQFLLSGACLPRDDPRAKATSVAEVNGLLDRLAQAEKKEQQVRFGNRLQTVPTPSSQR
jgi:hypothetical protein